MFNFFGKKRNPQPTPRWVTWVLVGGLAFAFLNHQLRPHGEKPAFDNTRKALQSYKERDVSLVKDKLLPRGAGNTAVKDIKTGEGVPAICGQTVSIAYTSTLADDSVIETFDKDHPLSFILGKKTVMPVLESAALGMQPSAIRSISNAADLSYNIDAYTRESVPQNSAVTFTIELLKATPAIPDAGAFRIFETNFGGGNEIACGDPVSVHLTLWSMDGKKFFSTRGEGQQPLSFTPGDGIAFIGLEQGVIGMLKGGARTMIVPPALQKTLTGTTPDILKNAPKGQTILVDVDALP